jgi:hypothetical protein
MKKLIIVSWFNSEIATPYINYFKNQSETKIVWLFKSRPVKHDNNIYPLECDLLNWQKIAHQLIDLLDTNQYEWIDKVFFLHFVWSFKYEWLSIDKDNDLNNDGIDDETFDTNINTFENVYETIKIVMQNKWSDAKLTLFNIWSKRDYNPKNVPWPSYAIVKNMLRKKFHALTRENDNCNALFINAWTIDIEKERLLRPNWEYTYWLSTQEVFDQSINDLETVSWYKEIELFKYHPKYETEFKNETLLDTHNRWLYEMGLL